MSKICWESFVLYYVQAGISVKKAKDIFKIGGENEELPFLERTDIHHLSKIHGLCGSYLMQFGTIPMIIENEDIFYSPCDEFGIYNVLNWLLHPNWGGNPINSRFINISNMQATIHLLIEHGLSPNVVDIHINFGLNVGDFVEFEHSIDQYATGKIIDISLNPMRYLILPLGGSPKFAKWLSSTSVVPLKEDSKSFIGDTILKRFKSLPNDPNMEKIYQSILNGQDANLKRRNTN